MPALLNTTNIYAQSDRIASQICGKRNWTAQDSATVALLAIMDQILDSGKSVEYLLARKGDEGVADTDAEIATKWRVEARNMLLPLMTAANNFQNSYLANTPSPDDGVMLMSKNTASKPSVEDLV